MYVSDLKGVGEKRLNDLNAAGIFTVRDLLMHFPAGYRDLSRITPLSDVRPGGMYAVHVTVAAPATQAWAKGLLITRCLVSDGTSEITCVFYNQPWMKGNLSVGRQLLLFGRTEMKGKKIQLSSPSVETEAGIQPVYKAIGSLQPKTLKQLMDKALSAARGTIRETLPGEIIDRFSLMNAEDMFFAIHQPENTRVLQEAMYRSSFENLLLFQIAAGLMRTTGKQGISIDELPLLLHVPVQNPTFGRRNTMSQAPETAHLFQYVTFYQKYNSIELSMIRPKEYTEISNEKLRAILYDNPKKICIKGNWYNVLTPSDAVRTISTVDKKYHFLYIQ
ncbi:MAG: hypothetical protein II266_06320, partial [Clostridia bacterium]|nr:hypothetical protein [Clostridia bacterium]